MDEFYSPESMRDLVHSSLVESLKQKEEKRSEADALIAENTRTSENDTRTIPHVRKMDKRQQRLSAGYGSLDDDTSGIFTSENTVEMRPKPENAPPAKRRLAMRHSLEGTIPEEREKDAKIERDRGSWSPMSRIAKLGWLANHRRSNEKHSPHHQKQESVDEGLHSMEVSDEDGEDGEDGGFERMPERKNNEKQRMMQEKLRRSLPNMDEFQKLAHHFMSEQGSF